jgi:hypothetical protein
LILLAHVLVPFLIRQYLIKIKHLYHLKHNGNHF